MQSIRFIGVCVMERSMVKNLLTAGYPKAVGQVYFGPLIRAMIGEIKSKSKGKQSKGSEPFGSEPLFYAVRSINIECVFDLIPEALALALVVIGSRFFELTQQFFLLFG